MDYARYHWFWRRKKLEDAGAITASLSGSSSISAFAHDAARGFDVASTINGSSSISADWRYPLNATVTINGSSSISQAELTDGSYSSTHAIQFNASTDRIALGAFNTLNGASSAWWSFWVRAESDIADGYVISNFASNNHQFYIWRINGHLRIYISDSLTASSAFAGYANNDVFTQDTWRHIVIQFDGAQSGYDKVALYSDGVVRTRSVAGGTLPATMTSPSTPDAYLGRVSSAISNVYLDSVAMGTGLLSAGDISELYNSGVPSNVNNIVFTGGTLTNWWSLGEFTDDSSNAYDQAGAFNGTITGASLVVRP